jgi:hypothetical protein
MTNPNGPPDPPVPTTQAEPPDLTEFDGEFEAARPIDNSKVPDGQYHVRVHDVTLGYSRKDDPMLSWEFVVLSGEHVNRHIFKHTVITKKSLGFVKGDLKTFGLELKRLSELHHRLDELIGHTLEITVRTKDEYTDVIFNQWIQVPVLEAGQSDDVAF